MRQERSCKLQQRLDEGKLKKKKKISKLEIEKNLLNLRTGHLWKKNKTQSTEMLKAFPLNWD